MSTHTPTPWKTEYENEFGPEYELFGPDGRRVLQYNWNSDRQAEVEANAAFVVRAVNCHDDLVAALKAVCGIGEEYEGMKWSDREKMVTDALAKAVP